MMAEVKKDEEVKVTAKANGEVKMSAPWEVYFSELCALFGQDDEIDMDMKETDGTEREIKIWVKSVDKADALMRLLPEKVVFGNITVKVTIYPPNEGFSSISDLYKAAFRDNPVMEHAYEVTTPFGTHTFVEFRKRVVQFYTDNMLDPNGFTSTLYQEIAKDVFTKQESVACFCTSVMDIQ